jgi:hypothetical protein
MLKIERRKALIGAINTRPENHGDQHVPAADLPVKFRCKASKFLPVFLRGATETSTDAFWMPDGSVRFPALGPLKIKGKFENVEMVISEEELADRVVTTLQEGKIADIILKPENDGQMEVSFKFQCRPGDDDWKRLVHLMKEECWIQLIERQQVLDLESKGESDDESEEEENEEEEAEEETA